MGSSVAEREDVGAKHFRSVELRVPRELAGKVTAPQDLIVIAPRGRFGKPPIVREDSGWRVLENVTTSYQVSDGTSFVCSGVYNISRLGIKEDSGCRKVPIEQTPRGTRRLGFGCQDYRLYTGDEARNLLKGLAVLIDISGDSSGAVLNERGNYSYVKF